MTAFIEELYLASIRSVKFAIYDYFSPIYKCYKYIANVMSVPNEVSKSNDSLTKYSEILISQEKRIKDITHELVALRSRIEELIESSRNGNAVPTAEAKPQKSSVYEVAVARRLIESASAEDFKPLKAGSSAYKFSYPTESEARFFESREKLKTAQRIKIRNISGSFVIVPEEAYSSYYLEVNEPIKARESKKSAAKRAYAKKGIKAEKDLDK